MKTEINKWSKECEEFQNWFANLGGNITNQEQMSEAFKRIEEKNVSDNNLFKLLEQDRIDRIEVVAERVEDFKDFSA